MGNPRHSTASLLVAACFSRHLEALNWAEEQLQPAYGPIVLRSADYAFHHTRYYESEMGAGLRKRLIVFEPLAPPDCLPAVKRHTIQLEHTLAESGRFAEARPLNVDPGLLQLGKFLLASTKDQGHRIFLGDGIFAEVTLRFHAGAFEPWPWTYADYREPDMLRFLGEARAWLAEKR
jgi:hypothetical protein